MTLAVNLNNGDSSKSHNGTFNIFSRRYVATGIMTREEGGLYRHLFSMRQTGDYDDLFDWMEDDVRPLIPKVADLIDKIHRLIE